MTIFLVWIGICLLLILISCAVCWREVGRWAAEIDLARRRRKD